MAIDEKTRAEILRLHYAEKWKIGTIAEQLGVHRATVDRVLADDGVPRRERRRRRSKVDPFLPFIRRTLTDYPRLTASRLYQMAYERGYRGSQSHFRRMVARERPRPVPEAYLRLKTLPGDQAQVDWAHFGKVRIGRAERRLMGFVMVLSYSRRIFLRFHLDAGMGNFLRGHIAAFEAWQGVPRELWYDNLSSVVAERRGDLVRYNGQFLRFAGHYLFHPRPVALARGNEKGRVERAIRYARDSFFAARKWRDIDDLNAQALAWCDGIAADRRWVEDRSITVREAFEKERGALLALPGDPFPAHDREEVRIGKTPYARFDLLCRYRHRRSHAANRTMPRQWCNPLIWIAFSLGFAAYSQGFQECQQLIGWLISARRCGDRFRPFHRLFLYPHVRMQVHSGGLHGFVTKPQCDNGAVDALVKEFHRGSVPKAVRTHAFGFQGPAAIGSQRDILVDDALDRVTAETAVAIADEQRLVIRRAPLRQPGLERLHRILPERYGARLAALTLAFHVGPCSEIDVAAVEVDQLRHPEAGLHAQEEQGPVPPPIPGLEIRGGEERLDFVAVEVRDGALFVPFRRQGEHLVAVMQELRFAHGHILEERADGCQPSVAAASAVTALDLKEVQEAPDEPGIDVGDQQVGRLPTETAGRERQQQQEGVAIACHRVVAGSELICETLGEEALNMCGKRMRGHDAPPSSKHRSARSLAKLKSSGTASMYQ